MSAPAAAVLTPRLIAVEDLAVSTAPGTTFVDEVLGLGPGQVLTKIPITLLTQLKSAANDAGAAAAGVVIGQCYYSTADSSLHTRMT